MQLAGHLLSQNNCYTTIIDSVVVLVKRIVLFIFLPYPLRSSLLLFSCLTSKGSCSYKRKSYLKLLDMRQDSKFQNSRTSDLNHNASHLTLSKEVQTGTVCSKVNKLYQLTC